MKVDLETLASELQKQYSETIITPQKNKQVEDMRVEFEEEREQLVRKYMVKEIAILKQTSQDLELPKV